VKKSAKQPLSISIKDSSGYVEFKKIKRLTLSKEGRAWVEVDISALKQNARRLQSLLSEQCSLMAVLKANAYGHGDIEVAKALNAIGIEAFAVATCREGIRLRKNGIYGEILILGYTLPCDLPCVAHYGLTQTVVDASHAKELNDIGEKIHVHIKVDTGMHRLGVDVFHIAQIESVFACENLIVDGIFSHLGLSQSLSKRDISETNRQIRHFFNVISILKTEGYCTGKVHLQSSYGILNYPLLPCDYARAGIALYGAADCQNSASPALNLQAVLSLKARIAAIKAVTPGQNIGYGRVFEAEAPMSIAVVAIGYADGVPRGYAPGFCYVLLHGKKAPVVGAICMDQMFIDCTNIPQAKAGDIVTIIGRDGLKLITCEEVAKKCGTIPNEILSRLSQRLQYKYIH